MTNETFKITVHTDLLQAVAVAASKDHAQYYLQGVHVAPDALGGVALVATDGRVLVASYCPDALPRGVDVPAFTIPSETLALLKSKAPVVEVEVTITGEGTLRRVDKFTLNEAITARPIDGGYPEWRRVIPRGEFKAGTDAAFDAAVIDKITKAQKLAGVPRVFHPLHAVSGGSNHLVRFGDRTDIFAAVMPYLVATEHNVFTAPVWSEA